MSITGIRKHLPSSTHFKDHKAGLFGQNISPKPGEENSGGNEDNMGILSAPPGCSKDMGTVNKDFVKAYVDLRRGRHKLAMLENPGRMGVILSRLNEIDAVIDMERDGFRRAWSD